jgi:hypothetical protein
MLVVPLIVAEGAAITVNNAVSVAVPQAFVNV